MPPLESLSGPFLHRQDGIPAAIRIYDLRDLAGRHLPGNVHRRAEGGLRRGRGAGILDIPVLDGRFRHARERLRDRHQVVLGGKFQRAIDRAKRILIQSNGAG